MKLIKYKGCLIKVTPSTNQNFWFGLFINQVFQGEWRSVELTIEEGKYFIDDSINKLKSIDQNIVIDNTWGEYIKNMPEILNSLKLLTGYYSYEEIFTMFEGFTIKRLLNSFE